MFLLRQDEAGQAVEPDSLIPLAALAPSHVVLVGDVCQLPPTVLSRHNSDRRCVLGVVWCAFACMYVYVL